MTYKQMEANVNSGLEHWRAEIDSIDAELLRLLNRRSSIVIAIGRLKQRAGLPLHDPERERKIIARVNQINVGPVDEKAVAKIFGRIIFELRRIASNANSKP